MWEGVSHHASRPPSMCTPWVRWLIYNHPAYIYGCLIASACLSLFLSTCSGTERWSWLGYQETSFLIIAHPLDYYRIFFFSFLLSFSLFHLQELTLGQPPFAPWCELVFTCDRYRWENFLLFPLRHIYIYIYTTYSFFSLKVLLNHPSCTGRPPPPSHLVVDFSTLKNYASVPLLSVRMLCFFLVYKAHVEPHWRRARAVYVSRFLNNEAQRHKLNPIAARLFRLKIASITKI